MYTATHVLCNLGGQFGANVASPPGGVRKFPKNFFTNSLKDAVPSSVLQLPQLVHVAVRERQFHSATTTMTRRLIGTVKVVRFLHARPEVVVVVFERVACWKGAFFCPPAAAAGTCSSDANVGYHFFIIENSYDHLYLLQYPL